MQTGRDKRRNKGKIRAALNHRVALNHREIEGAWLLRRRPAAHRFPSPCHRQRVYPNEALRFTPGPVCPFTRDGRWRYVGMGGRLETILNHRQDQDSGETTSDDAWGSASTPASPVGIVSRSRPVRGGKGKNLLPDDRQRACANADRCVISHAFPHGYPFAASLPPFPALYAMLECKATRQAVDVYPRLHECHCVYRCFFFVRRLFRGPHSWSILFYLSLTFGFCSVQRTGWFCFRWKGR